MSHNFTNFKAFIGSHSFSEVAPIPSALQMWQRQSGKHSVFYAPLEHQNARPMIALVGITPGHTQAVKALQVAQAALRQGDSDETCLAAAKIYASFCGSMRDDLINMLDSLGINKLIGEDTTRNLWTAAGYPKAHFCSLLQFPTFQASKNFNSLPNTRTSEAFRTMLETTAKTLDNLPQETIILPLGQTVGKALVRLQKDGLLKRNLLLVAGKPICVPHPSGENAESVRLVLDWKHECGLDYAEASHSNYLREKNWLKQGRREPQDPQRYKAARQTRWRAVHSLRECFGAN